MKTILALAAIALPLAACGAGAATYGYAPGYHHRTYVDPIHDNNDCLKRQFPQCTGSDGGGG